MKQSITCTNLDDFMDVIESLVKKGLTFRSNASTLVIELTGGY